MGRQPDPLRRMEAQQICRRQGGKLAPLTIVPSKLRAMEYTLPVASAQVKSCILLAGMYGRADHRPRAGAGAGSHRAHVDLDGRADSGPRADDP
ncbi:MAG: hypothetical protein R2856_20470 [Caldilineaceae bacterium]